MNDKADIKALAAKIGKTLKTEAEHNALIRELRKATLEAALNAELDDHLGYGKHAPNTNSNSRNGHSCKTLTTDDGELALSTPRDREGSFEP